MASAAPVASSAGGAGSVEPDTGYTSFKAISVSEWGDPKVMKVVDNATLAPPSHGQVIVKLAYAGVNPVDTYIRSGAYARKPSLPFTPGKDGAGTIAAVGDGVSLKVGARVYVSGSISGTYAQYTLCNADTVHPLPDNVPFKLGAALGIPANTAYRALFTRGHLKAGDWVLIHGASGAVGLPAVQMAADVGANVIGTAGSDAGIALVKAAGAHHALRHGKSANTVEEVLDITGGSGVNLVVEMLAHVNLGKDCKMLAKGGTVAVVGNRGEAVMNPRDLMAREASVVGVMLGGASAAERQESFAYLHAKLKNGVLLPQVGVEFAMADAPAAHVEVIEHAKGTAGKVVLQV